MSGVGLICGNRTGRDRLVVCVCVWGGGGRGGRNASCVYVCLGGRGNHITLNGNKI